MMTKQPELEMLDYYRARAPLMQYQGLSPETERVLATYADYFGDRLAARSVLEVACGTGFWTQMLARQARSVVATDAAPEMLALARSRQYELSNVELILDDAYRLGKVRDGFDGGFHFQWISHVPRARLQEFFSRFHGRLSTESVVVFGDNKDQGTQADSDGNLYQERTLPDGSRHRVIKNWLTRDELRTLLQPWTDALHFQEFERDWFVCYKLRS
jgi:demethylmenaquinone methyltransferase/2-methoxy-6-polyprenyl-1,4-benzoquinol methylase